MAERVIFHVDANSAFLSWSAAYRVLVLHEETDLREIPSVVGVKESRHSIVLAKSDVRILKKWLAKHGETIWHFANGRNGDVVTPEPAENKGYVNSVTTAYDVTSKKEAAQVFLSLCETVAMRMRRDGKCGSCVSIHLRTNDFRHSSHQMILHGATNITAEIFEAACILFQELWD